MGAVTNDRLARYLEKVDSTPGEDGVSAADRTLEEMFHRMTGTLGECEALPAICKAWDVPYGKVLTWLMADAGRYEVYQRALEVQAHLLVSEAVDIADSTENDVARDKLRVETRFRVAKHHASKVYGDKVDVNHNVTPVFSVVINAGGGGASPQGEVIGPCIVGDYEAVSRETGGVDSEAAA